MSRFRVYADRFIPGLRASLPRHVEIIEFDPSEGVGEECAQADGLIIRTVTPLNEWTAPWLDRPDRTLGFIATATSGTDHMDVEWLRRLGIRVESALGCNAQAVAEYVASGLLHWCDHSGLAPAGLVVGVIGVGHAGSAVSRLLTRLGFTCLDYDPPRERRDPEFKGCTWSELGKAHIWTLHTPLETEGEHPTQGLIHGGIRTPPLLVNAARGGIVQEAALHPGTQYLCDVWEGEPAFNPRTAERAILATPHIAGYSAQGKSTATSMVASALCDHLGLEVGTESSLGEESAVAGGSAFARGGPVAEESTVAGGSAFAKEKALPVENPADADSEGRKASGMAKEASAPGSLAQALEWLHPMFEASRSMKVLSGLPQKERAEGFAKLRRIYPLRDEYRFIKIPQLWMDAYPELGLLGCTS